MFKYGLERSAVMALDLFMIGLAPKDLDKSLEFYRRLGLALPEESQGKTHVGVKMRGEISFFLNTTELVDIADRPSLVLEFYLRQRPAVDAKYNELTGFGYES